MRDVEINPNALVVGRSPEGTWAAAGTLDRGVLVYEATTDQWTARLAGLPSPNVTAIARGETRIYVGTDNGLVVFADGGLLSF